MSKYLIFQSRDESCLISSNGSEDGLTTMTMENPTTRNPDPLYS